MNEARQQPRPGTARRSVGSPPVSRAHASRASSLGSRSISTAAGDANADIRQSRSRRACATGVASRARASSGSVEHERDVVARDLTRPRARAADRRGRAPGARCRRRRRTSAAAASSARASPASQPSWRGPKSSCIAAFAIRSVSSAIAFARAVCARRISSTRASPASPSRLLRRSRIGARNVSIARGDFCFHRAVADLARGVELLELGEPRRILHERARVLEQRVASISPGSVAECGR